MYIHLIKNSKEQLLKCLSIRIIVLKNSFTKIIGYNM